jgi:hypothetical protein
MEFGLRTYVGNLELYDEQGMESQAPILHDDRGLSKGPSWNDKTKKFDGPDMEYKDISWAIFLMKGAYTYHAKIFKKNGSIKYEGPLTFSLEKLKTNNYRISFFPKELTKDDWLMICMAELRCELTTNQFTYKEEKDYSIKYRVGQKIIDDLTQQECSVLGVSLGDNSTLGYLIDSAYLDGRRHPWELTKIGEL